ncbi:TetR/AcrR family transcriptional regulator [Pseudomonas matsuisoli]|uniref:Transcriptional regulator n=1 Tax=Pseudomonas matsuisoli TaxID=1515666 RepID=A0A917Q0Z3_9PSED|nr:TetR/AcrR family transcriptional regulator [Pseudomonas matsuisoli]GGK03473.1 transcriptional regulator [Pseudomonas matsuisoli]
MTGSKKEIPEETARQRLSKAERRQQLLETARIIARDEGADRLTLSYLAACAGVSKPVVYDHFGTRSGVLIELYRWLDMEQVSAFQQAMAASEHGLEETVSLLAAAYIRCAADMEGEVHAIGAALAGSDEKAKVFQALLDNCVQMFLAVLQPHSSLTVADLTLRCVGLVGAGEALAATIVKETSREADAISAFECLIYGALDQARPRR